MSVKPKRVAEVEVYQAAAAQVPGGFNVFAWDTVVPGRWESIYDTATGVFTAPFRARCEIDFQYAIRCIYPDDVSRIWAVLPEINGFFHEVKDYQQTINQASEDPIRFYSRGWTPVNDELKEYVEAGDEVAINLYQSDFNAPRDLQGSKFWSRVRVRFTEY